MTSTLAPPPDSAASCDAPKPSLRELRGVVERITYQNPDNGYTVARLAPERVAEGGMAAAVAGDDRLVTLVGTLADLTPGEAIEAHGWWRNDPKHGWQFQAQDYRTVLPATLQGMKKYLGSGLVRGVGPVMGGRIVDAFGEGTFEVIGAAPERPLLIIRLHLCDLVEVGQIHRQESVRCGRGASPRPGRSSATSAR